MQGYGGLPVADKSSDEAVLSLQHFAGTATIMHFSDNSPGLVAAACQLQWPHMIATPGRPATNGVAERAARRRRGHAYVAPSRWAYGSLVASRHAMFRLLAKHRQCFGRYAVPVPVWPTLLGTQDSCCFPD